MSVYLYMFEMRVDEHVRKPAPRIPSLLELVLSIVITMIYYWNYSIVNDIYVNPEIVEISATLTKNILKDNGIIPNSSYIVEYYKNNIPSVYNEAVNDLGAFMLFVILFIINFFILFFTILTIEDFFPIS
jgi:hypothetical protein